MGGPRTASRALRDRRSSRGRRSPRRARLAWPERGDQQQRDRHLDDTDHTPRVDVQPDRTSDPRWIWFARFRTLSRRSARIAALSSTCSKARPRTRCLSRVEAIARMRHSTRFVFLGGFKPRSWTQRVSMSCRVASSIWLRRTAPLSGVLRMLRSDAGSNRDLAPVGSA